MAYALQELSQNALRSPEGRGTLHSTYHPSLDLLALLGHSQRVMAGA